MDIVQKIVQPVGYRLGNVVFNRHCRRTQHGVVDSLGNREGFGVDRSHRIAGTGAARTHRNVAVGIASDVVLISAKARYRQYCGVCWPRRRHRLCYLGNRCLSHRSLGRCRRLNVGGHWRSGNRGHLRFGLGVTQIDRRAGEQRCGCHSRKNHVRCPILSTHFVDPRAIVALFFDWHRSFDASLGYFSAAHYATQARESGGAAPKPANPKPATTKYLRFLFVPLPFANPAQVHASRVYAAILDRRTESN